MAQINHLAAWQPLLLVLNLLSIQPSVYWVLPHSVQIITVREHSEWMYGTGRGACLCDVIYMCMLLQHLQHHLWQEHK